ncbi:hypothetical protein Dsin_009533 [Dipteronia sinensis]|uniref:Plant heme peroxidase family profile domain-containing protein n=1 Tax=Dipteronia sinensis TaxID=43782 RepID=A0AAE0AQT1_9ROSI|nr:hypothetical protein Dsin_009533 [Dipteronia sinensis]
MLMYDYRLIVEVKGHLTNRFCKTLRMALAVLESDSKLNDDIVTKSVIESYVGFLNPILGPSFEADFVESIVKMGQIGVKTGLQGEIRRVCAAFN